MELDEALASIAESLREERGRSGLTLEQLAQRAELSTAHLSRLESGERQPSVAALLALARALGVSMSTLLGERRGAPAVATYLPGTPTHESNGLTIAPCSGFPGSTTLEALQISIRPDREPPEPARHRGEEWIYVVAGRLRLEFDGRSTCSPDGALGTRPGRSAGSSGDARSLVVARWTAHQDATTSAEPPACSDRASITDH